MSPELLILAAGMGSRYGSLKQLEIVGPSEETLLYRSVFDAIRAGFERVVFFFRRNCGHEFRERIGHPSNVEVGGDGTMKVPGTGGAGFIGSYATCALISKKNHSPFQRGSALFVYIQ